MTPDAREQARHKASVMIAFADGKEIQVGPLDGQGPWIDYNEGDGPTWDFKYCLYRVKPEERKPREIQVWVNNEYPGISRDEKYFSDNQVAYLNGWTLTTFKEVLPSENTGKGEGL
jgi:hypothetical protein